MQVINEFFVKDGSQVGIRIKKSILLALIDDMQFCLGIYRRYKILNLTPSDHEKLLSVLPSFSVLLLYFTGIDVLARVKNRSLPKAHEEGQFFKGFLREYGDLEEQAVNELYELRKEAVHKYSLRPKHTLRRFGSSNPAEKLDQEHWVFTLNAMYSNLINIKSRFYEELLKSNKEIIQDTEDYLEKNGFIYIRT